MLYFTSYFKKVIWLHTCNALPPTLVLYITSCSKEKKRKQQQKKHVKHHSRIHARDRSHLMFVDECKWSQWMDNYDNSNLAPKKKKKKDENTARASLSGTFMILWNFFGCWR